MFTTTTNRKPSGGHTHGRASFAKSTNTNTDKDHKETADKAETILNGTKK